MSIIKSLDLDSVNQTLETAEPVEILQWAFDLNKKPIVTTNFGPFAAVMLHMATRIKPDIPVIWIDTGYNTEDTYLVSEKLIHQLNLNIKVYTPTITAARRNAVMHGIPDVNSKQHEEFTYQVKLEPFMRAMSEVKADIWLTAIRKDQTSYRKSLQVVSPAPNNMIKVAPFLNWTEVDMEGYLWENDLPNVQDYHDPTKVMKDRECGLHTMAVN